MNNRNLTVYRLHGCRGIGAACAGSGVHAKRNMAFAGQLARRWDRSRSSPPRKKDLGPGMQFGMVGKLRRRVLRARAIRRKLNQAPGDKPCSDSEPARKSCTSNHAGIAAGAGAASASVSSQLWIPCSYRLRYAISSTRPCGCGTKRMNSTVSVHCRRQAARKTFSFGPRCFYSRALARDPE